MTITSKTVKKVPVSWTTKSGEKRTAVRWQAYLHLWHSAEDRTRVAADALARQTLATVHEPCTEEPIQG